MKMLYKTNKSNNKTVRFHVRNGINKGDAESEVKKVIICLTKDRVIYFCF